MPLKKYENFVHNINIYYFSEYLYNSFFYILMFIQLLLFEYTDVILTETENVRFYSLRRTYDNQRNAESP